MELFFLSFLFSNTHSLVKFLQGNVPREFPSRPVVMGSTPGWGAKTPKAMRHGNGRTEKRKEEKSKCTKRQMN